MGGAGSSGRPWFLCSHLYDRLRDNGASCPPSHVDCHGSRHAVYAPQNPPAPHCVTLARSRVPPPPRAGRDRLVLDHGSCHLEQRAPPFRRQALEGGLASVMPHFEHPARPQPRPSQLVAPGACWPDDGLRQFVKERAKRPQPSTAGNLATATGQGSRACGRSTICAMPPAYRRGLLVTRYLAADVSWSGQWSEDLRSALISQIRQCSGLLKLTAAPSPLPRASLRHLLARQYRQAGPLRPGP